MCQVRRVRATGGAAGWRRLAVRRDACRPGGLGPYSTADSPPRCRPRRSGSCLPPAASGRPRQGGAGRPGPGLRHRRPAGPVAPSTTSKPPAAWGPASTPLAMRPAASRRPCSAARRPPAAASCRRRARGRTESETSRSPPPVCRRRRQLLCVKLPASAIVSRSAGPGRQLCDGPLSPLRLAQAPRPASPPAARPGCNACCWPGGRARPVRESARASGRTAAAAGLPTAGPGSA